MNSEIKKYEKEITDNFSELFVETFFIRYIFDDNKLLECIKETLDLLNQKINSKFKEKLKILGINEDKIIEFINKKEA